MSVLIYAMLLVTDLYRHQHLEEGTRRWFSRRCGGACANSPYSAPVDVSGFPVRLSLLGVGAVQFQQCDEW